MKNKCRFSVIISAYNIEAYIERAIKSVLNQNFNDYEIIVVDDKSTDNTLQKIMKYENKVKIIKNEKNMGLGAVRNIAIDRASGEYIVHLDGDDTLYNESTLKDIDELISDKTPDIVFLGFQEINGNNRLRLSTEENSTKEARLICDACFSVPSKCWRREFLIQNDIKFVENIYYEDMIYSMKAVTLSKETMYGDFPIYNYYRNRSGSIMTTPSIRRCTDMYKMLVCLMELYEEAPKNLKKYILSFIINETQSIPEKIKAIIKAIENNENAPIFPKRQYNFVDIDDEKKNKKKIALVADAKDWAFWIAAKIIKNSLSNKYQIDIFYTKSEEFNKDLFKILESLKDYDLIHFFWRAILLDFEKEEFKSKVEEHGYNYDEYVKNNVKKISTGVYDYIYEDDIEFIKIFTKYCNNYVVSCKKLYDIYSNLDGIKKPKAILGDSFEKNMFYPVNMERFDFKDNTKDKLVIGWVGNSKWNENQKDKNGNFIDFKGYYTILKPVIEELQSEGYNIELKIADKNVNQIPNERLCEEFYSKIHIYVCVAATEGTPKPLLEAMGCAIPVVCTDAGVVSEALGEKQSKYILGERIIGENDDKIRKELKSKLIYLYNNRGELKQLSEENYIQSKEFEIENMKNKYSEYYDFCMNNN